MCLMSDVEIEAAVARGDVRIQPFEPDCVEPASYDLRLGRHALVTRNLDLAGWRQLHGEDSVTEHDVEVDGSLRIPAGAFALVVTHERIGLSKAVAGHLGAQSTLTRKGLLLLAGAQVDPGFDGYLVVGFANLSHQNVTLRFCERIVTMDLSALDTPARSPYAGGAQGRQVVDRIPTDDADRLRHIGNTLTVMGLTREIESVDRRLLRLEQLTDKFGIPILTGTLVGLIGVALGAGVTALVN